jgi:hypothetical protein
VVRNSDEDLRVVQYALESGRKQRRHALYLRSGQSATRHRSTSHRSQKCSIIVPLGHKNSSVELGGYYQAAGVVLIRLLYSSDCVGVTAVLMLFLFLTFHCTRLATLILFHFVSRLLWNSPPVEIYYKDVFSVQCKDSTGGYHYR